MTLRVRALGLVGLVFLGLLAVVLVLVSTGVLGRFTEIERAAAERDAERVRRALEAELDSLDVLAADWAVWDTTYEFVRSRGEEFIRSNLNRETIGALRASLVAFIDAEGELVWGRWLDRASGSLVPLPAELGQYLRPGAPLASRSEAAASLKGVVALRDGVLAVASRAILTSTGSGPCRGTFVLGRPLGAAEIASLGRAVDTAVTAQAAGEELPADFAAALAELAPGRRVHVRALGQSRVAAYQLVRDIAGRPALLLKVEMPRSLYREGLAVARLLVGVLVLAVLAFGVAMLAGLERMVLARVARLSSGLRAIAGCGDPAGRVRVDGGDELARLASDVNKALAAVEAAGAALRESEERFRRLIDLLPDGLLVACNGRVVFANDRMAAMIGATGAGAVTGREVLAPVAAESRDLFARLLRQLEAGREVETPAGVRLLRDDGAAVDAEVSAIPYLHEGRPAVQALVRDVTARTRLEAAVRRAQKIEAIGQLAGGLAHGFNNLFQAVLGGLEVLRLRGAAHPRHDEAVRELAEQVRRGAALARQLLLFSQREVTKKEPLDLNVVVGETVGMLRGVVRETVEIRSDLDPESLPVVADRGQLEQILVNLAMNASDAMPEGGELRLRTGAEGETAWMEIADSGAGMTEGVKARIFEPFFTTKAGGNGLGLAVVHGIVSHHGGRVSVSSAPGRGTLFRVALPLVRQPRAGTAAPAAPGGSEPLAAGRGERILVVEDEDVARTSLVEMLTLLGYEAAGVCAGEEARSLPAAPAYDLLLTDFILPGIDGVQLARELRTAWPELRVIVMSGYSEDEALRSGVGRGEMRYLQKPFGLSSLAAEVAAALAGRT
jgi:PAS domain S-box-containing protein